MSEPTDDQLDGLFRKSAEEFGPSYDPAAWQDMKAQLDRNDRMAPAGSLLRRNLFRWGLPIILLLLITGIGWYAYTKTKSTAIKSTAQIDSSEKSALDLLARSRQQVETSGSTHKESIRPVPTDLSKHTVEPENQLVTTTEPEAETVAVAERGKPAIKVGKADKVDAELGKTSIPIVDIATKPVISAYTVKSGRNRIIGSRPDLLSVKAKPSHPAVRYANARRRKESGAAPKWVKKVSGYERTAFSKTSNAFPTTSTFSKHRGRITLNPKSEWISTIDSPMVGTPAALATVVIMLVKPLIINEMASRFIRWPKSFTTIERAVLAHPDTTARTRIIVPSVPVQKGFSIQLAMAPDLSTIGLKNFTRPGTNMGLLLEYRLTKRWSIQAGVIQSTKVYKAGAEDYVVPESMLSSSSYKKPETVDGRCNMLDIPLNVRYDLVLQPRTNGRLPSRWFMSGGLTTYVMNKEDYQYTYSSYTHGQKNDWSTSTGGYGFSNLNLSVGYEGALGKRLFWQVEPFIKLPLKGVGAYKINLLSTGSFFSIRYKL